MLRAGHEALPAPTSCAAAQTAHCPGPGVPRRRRRKSPGPLGTAAAAPTGSLWLRAAQLLPPERGTMDYWRGKLDGGGVRIPIFGLNYLAARSQTKTLPFANFSY